MTKYEKFCIAVNKALLFIVFTIMSIIVITDSDFRNILLLCISTLGLVHIIATGISATNRKQY
jgi:hypothetical protein